MTGHPLRILAFVVAALLSSPSVVLARAAMICSMSGPRPVSACCCASAHARGAQQAKRSPAEALSETQRAQLEAAPCCSFDVSDGSAAAPSKASNAPSELLGPALAGRLSDEPLGPIPWVLPVASGWSYRGPPPSGPPLFIKHCTLLN